MKRIGCLLLALLLLAGLAGCAKSPHKVEYPVYEGKFKYVLREEGVTLAQYIGTETDVTLPAEVEGKPLVRIDAYAFDQNSTMQSITLPDTAVNIGNGAFRDCTALAHIALPDGLQRLSSDCFAGCAALKEIALPSGLSFLPTSCFEGCSSLEALVLPEGCESIASRALWGCNSLESLTLPASLTRIDANALAGVKCVIYCPENSYAAQWAEENNYPYGPEGSELEWVEPEKTPTPTATPFVLPVEAPKADSKLEPGECLYTGTVLSEDPMQRFTFCFVLSADGRSVRDVTFIVEGLSGVATETHGGKLTLGISRAQTTYRNSYPVENGRLELEINKSAVSLALDDACAYGTVHYIHMQKMSSVGSLAGPSQDFTYWLDCGELRMLLRNDTQPGELPPEAAQYAPEDTPQAEEVPVPEETPAAEPTA